jgi:hypothetical protein
MAVSQNHVQWLQKRISVLEGTEQLLLHAIDSCRARGEQRRLVRLEAHLAETQQQLRQARSQLRRLCDKDEVEPQRAPPAHQ